MMKVCDAIMGGGKSQGCIQYMREHADHKFIYIAPYIDETERIKNECPDLHFVLPDHYEKYDRRKINHIEALIDEGRNISTTHAAFRCFTPKMLQDVKEKDYTLVMDEVVDLMVTSKISYYDIQVLVDTDKMRLNEDTLMYEYIGDPDYPDKAGVFPGICRIARCNNLYLCTDKGTEFSRQDAYYYFSLPLDFIKAFNEVFVLTYMFEGSELCAMCKAHGIEYEYIGIEKIDRGTGFILSETGTYIPEYVNNLSDLIHIYDDNDEEVATGRGRRKKKLNTYYTFEGRLHVEKDFHLSHSFYNKKKKNEKLIKEIRNNQRTFFNRMIEQHGGTRDLCQWSVYKNALNELKSPGIQNQFVSLNKRAVNDYANRCYLSYLCDLHLQPEKIRYYKQFNIEYNQDLYAVSTLLQWMWRSRIRKQATDGSNEIWIYVPSKRMRSLLEQWIATPYLRIPS